MAYSDPLELLPLGGSAAVEGSKVREKSFFTAGIRSGGPEREDDKYETIRFTYIDGSAKFGEDYGVPDGEKSGTIRIKYGGGTGAIFVPLIVDTQSESDETFSIRFDRVGTGESQTVDVLIVDRPLSEPAPLPKAPPDPGPAWWPPGFPSFSDEPEEEEGSGSGGGSSGSGGGGSGSGGGSSGSGGGSSGSGGGSSGSGGGSSGSGGGSSDSGGGSSGSGGGRSPGSSETTREREKRENAANESVDTSNLNSFDIVPQVVAIDGKSVEKYYFDMTAYATPERDGLGGSRLPDYIRLLDSDDRFTGGRGGDLVYGDSGADTINGNQGEDLIEGGLGNDFLRGGKDDDVINPGEGDDWVNGNQGDDLINGGLGKDIVRGGKGGDVIDLGEGDDWVNGNKGDDSIRGGLGDDYLIGGKGSDVLWGDEGADRFVMSEDFNIVKDFRFSEGDAVVVLSEATVGLTQRNGEALLLTEEGALLFEGVAMEVFDVDQFVLKVGSLTIL